MIFYYLFFCLLVASALAVDGPIVQTSLGYVQGYYNYSQNGRKFEAFVKVPFAKAPTGNLRFEPPSELNAWTGTLAATEMAPNCMGYNPFSGSSNPVYGSEDCLYLKIYTPNHQPKKLQPVIVWFHPGPLHFKILQYYGPSYLMDRDVVFIDVNFRLGPLGFLSTEDDIIPGNMGLKDQTMALKWISKHIESFGGDPKKVMIVGGSGGGICVNYHYLSPLSRGLFHSGMSLSGSAASIYLQRSNSLKNANSLAKMVNCSYDDVGKMVDCLRTKPAENLTYALSGFPAWNGYLFYSPFGVVVEKSGKDSFLDQPPIDVLESGDVYDVPWLAGTVNGDGMFPAGGTAHQDDTLLVLQSPGVQDSVKTENDLAMQKNLLDLWVSMAQNGEPEIGGVKWSPVNASDDNLQYLLVSGPNNFTSKEDPNFSNRLFWDSLSLKDSIL